MSEFQEYNKLITKSTIIGKVMQLVRESYEECADEARKKNESCKILDKNLQDADKLLKQLANLQGKLQKEAVAAKYVTQEQKIKIQDQTEKLMVMVLDFANKKKGFPIRVNPFLQSSFNSLKAQLDNIQFLIQKIEVYKAAGCCSCSSNLKKEHQSNIAELNKSLSSLEHQQIFWEYLSYCEAREGYYEIHDAPRFEDKSFEIQLSQILEFILPEIIKAQIQKEIIYKDVEVEKPVIVEKIVERVIQLEDKVGTATRLLKLETGRDVAKGLRILLEEVEKENTEAMTYLGAIYNDGQLVPMDKQKAFRYYEMAAIKGSSEGWYRIGVMIEEGALDKQEISLLRECLINNQIQNINLKPNIVKAIYCYEQAGDKHGDALTDLGIKIPQEEEERNVQEWFIYPDKQKAEEYYEKAKQLEFYQMTFYPFQKTSPCTQQPWPYDN